MITATTTVHFLHFLTTCIHYKTRIVRTFRPVFILFSCPPVPLHPTTPMQTRHYPFKYSCVPLRLICKKHHVRGNFPGHSATKSPEKTCFDFACLVFVSPCASCTQSHPSAPIRTRLHPFIPVCTLNYNLYMYNLIKKY